MQVLDVIDKSGRICCKAKASCWQRRRGETRHSVRGGKACANDSAATNVKVASAATSVTP